MDFQRLLSSDLPLDLADGRCLKMFGVFIRIRQVRAIEQIDLHLLFDFYRESNLELCGVGMHENVFPILPSRYHVTNCLRPHSRSRLHF